MRNFMITTKIDIELDADAASIFADAPAEDRSKLCVLWGILLREYKAAPMPLSELMDQIGTRAKVRGVTADKLESILDAK